jgi:hypothetical protein
MKSYRYAWLGLFVLAIATAAVVFIPIWLIQPFAAQTRRAVDVSYLLRSWSPLFTLAATGGAIGLAFYIWTHSKRWFAKLLLVVPLFVTLGFTWLARQNHFEWMFNPLGQPAYAKISDVNFVSDDDMVLAVSLNGESAAYPVRQMAYHHVVQDVVGGMPITATY